VADSSTACYSGFAYTLLASGATPRVCHRPEPQPVASGRTTLSNLADDLVGNSSVITSADPFIHRPVFGVKGFLKVSDCYLESSDPAGLNR